MSRKGAGPRASDLMETFHRHETRFTIRSDLAISFRQPILPVRCVSADPIASRAILYAGRSIVALVTSRSMYITCTLPAGEPMQLASRRELASSLLPPAKLVSIIQRREPPRLDFHVSASAQVSPRLGTKHLSRRFRRSMADRKFTSLGIRRWRSSKARRSINF